ncbi:pyridoxal phosphate phosphatase [Plakobranchus ocellatus]|uniref:Pyridoxal phosphate phosphatase n=1 Tax=Plakobranchus ocellatus TaxID=259542 RepID=A0AAV4BQ44_9GAST|nr:pyridoxal phosphate phosphatase [Plakobranchus ocellatus]
MEAVAYLSDPTCRLLSFWGTPWEQAMDSDLIVPDVGALAAAIAHPLKMQPQTPRVHSWFMSHVLRRARDIKPVKTAVIGTNIDREIAFANNSGMSSLLLLTDEAKKAGFLEKKFLHAACPDYYATSILEWGQHIFPKTLGSGEENSDVSSDAAARSSEKISDA